MTPLKKHILTTIKRAGSISVAHYMDLCLFHPLWGYYTAKDPLGKAGDFITAPEISQMFGELLGLWLVDTWRTLRPCAPFLLVEAGGGRGTLLTDALRAVKKVAPDFEKASRLHLVETSPLFKAMQKQAFPKARFYRSMAQLPRGPMFFIANEFFDALPIHQYAKHKDKWYELRVVAEDEKFKTVPAKEPATIPEVSLAHNSALKSCPEGTIVETCPLAHRVMQVVACRLARYGGAALIVDYGYESVPKISTLQAVHNHEKVSPWEKVGHRDITAHVNFGHLSHIARLCGVKVDKLFTQGDFLHHLGIKTRKDQLMQACANDHQRHAIETGYQRLTACPRHGETV